MLLKVLLIFLGFVLANSFVVGAEIGATEIVNRPVKTLPINQTRPLGNAEDLIVVRFCDLVEHPDLSSLISTRAGGTGLANRPLNCRSNCDKWNFRMDMYVSTRCEMVREIAR